ncbi:MAG: COX15/CtaA family protein [Cyclobacteriaceae bacterium]
MRQPDLRFYKNFLLALIATICLLILAGGIVRSSGSGMGCPDWPKCFGSWIPPTHISELPTNYKEAYSSKRQEKNLKLSRYFELLGFNNLADQLRNDKSILVEASFNANKTWIEYVNRLLGVVTGFLIFINVILAFKYRRHNRIFVFLAILNLVLVGFQGWVGSVVVSTNLLPGIITFHMILALIILGVAIYNYWLTQNANTKFESITNHKKIFWLLVMAVILFLIQVGLGTQVREAIDTVSALMGESMRGQWIEELGFTFYFHRSYSLLLLLIHGYISYLILRSLTKPFIRQLVYFLMALMMFEIIAGAWMSYFAIPPFLQPIHLLLATMIFAIDFYLLLEFKPQKSVIPIFKNT